MTDQQDQPQTKRPAMQVALDAERVAAANGRQLAELAGEVANISALAVEAAESGGGAQEFAGIKSALSGIVKDLGKVVGLIPGNLWVGKGGALATQQQVAEVRDQVAEKAQQTVDAVLAMDSRLRGFEEWQASVRPYSDHLRDMRATIGELAAWRESLGGHLPSEQADQILYQLERRTGDALSELREQVGQLRHGGGSSAPHVLGLIAQLQKLVHEISKGREFKAENSRGAVTQQYSFRGIDEAQNAIGSAQREIGLIGPKVTIIDKTVNVTEVDKGSYTQVWTTVSVTARYTFQSPVDGSEWSTEGCGMGRDLGDKAESKALAGAFKYALFHGLNIPVKGVFVDAETEDPRIERQQSQDTGRTYGHGQPAAEVGDFTGRDLYDRYGPGKDDPSTWKTPALAEQDPSPANAQASLAAQQAAPAKRPDTRTADELARDALAAVRRAANANEAAEVWNWVYQKQMLTVGVDGVPVGQHMLAAIRLLPGGDQAEQLPGWGQFR